MIKLIYLFSLLLPWAMRRRVLIKLFGFEIHPTARIGLSWIMPQRLTMGAHSRIGSLTLCKGLEHLQLDAHGRIGNGNWITGFPPSRTGHFSHQADRHPVLIVREHAAITNRHLIDCTNSVEICRFATFAGFQSQILTHSIDLQHCRQSSAPVVIGEYCFVGTNVVILGGSSLPNYSVLGAKSLLNRAFSETHTLYGGVPAKPLKALEADLGYFQRKDGFVE
jgi:carbonic anhydrase/acetyltransferase-like protein (isoleucine patch superfamily)